LKFYKNKPLLEKYTYKETPSPDSGSKWTYLNQLLYINRYSLPISIGFIVQVFAFLYGSPNQYFYCGTYALSLFLRPASFCVVYFESWCLRFHDYYLRTWLQWFIIIFNIY